MVEVGTATSKEKEIKTDWPVEEGLIAGTTTQEGNKTQLEAEGHLGVKSIVREIDKVGF
jgi:hypothetical protein